MFGFARSKMTDADFRQLIASTLTCRVSARCVRHRHRWVGSARMAFGQGTPGPWHRALLQFRLTVPAVRKPGEELRV